MSRTESKIALVVLVALAVVLSVSLEVERAGAAFPGRNGKIAFNTNHGIYTVKANGGGRRKLRGSGFEPAWSPNGKEIAFVREDGDWKISGGL